MSLLITCDIDISYVGEGMGPRGTSRMAQVVTVPGPQVVVAGGAAPTAAQIIAAFTSAAALMASSATAPAVLAQVDAFSAGAS